MSKLTLSVDADVVESAKRYAAARGTSVSKLVQDYLAAVSADSNRASGPPVLERLRGALRGADTSVEEHRQHLVRKYG